MYLYMEYSHLAYLSWWKVKSQGEEGPVQEGRRQCGAEDHSGQGTVLEGHRKDS